MRKKSQISQTQQECLTSQGSPLRIESKSITPSAWLEYKHNKI